VYGVSSGYAFTLIRTERSMGVAAAAELVAALAFSGDRWRAQLLAKGFLQARLTTAVETEAAWFLSVAPVGEH